MLRLHDYLDSGNGYKARLLLSWLGMPYELVEYDILRGETHTHPSSSPGTPMAAFPSSSSRMGRTSPNRTPSCSTSPRAAPICPATG